MDSSASSTADRTVDVTATPLERTFHPNLEAIRGVAAVAVVLHHAPFPGRINSSTFATQTWLFVDLFFVLSGFVIALVHLREPAGWASARTFLIRRLFRIYPLHFVMMLGMMLMIVARLTIYIGARPDLGLDRNFAILSVANLLLVQAWGFHGDGILNGPSWSISTEWMAYLIVAFICSWISTPIKRLSAIMAVGAFALGLLLVFNNASIVGDYTWRSARCLYAFSLGTAIWWLFYRGYRPLHSLLVQLTALVIVTIVMVYSLRWHPLTLLFPPATALLVWGAAADRVSALFRLLNTHVPQWLGQRSYSIYLVHLPLFTPMSFFEQHFHGVARFGRLVGLQMAGDILSVAAIALVFPVAAFTYRWIEVPWRDRGRRIAAQAAA